MNLFVVHNILRHCLNSSTSFQVITQVNISHRRAKGRTKWLCRVLPKHKTSQYVILRAQDTIIQGAPKK